MWSQWQHLKTAAIQMRRRGVAIRDVEKRLGIPRSTLSYWFKDVQMSAHHKKRLEIRARHSLIKARREATKWHNAQKDERIKLAISGGAELLSQIDIHNDAIAELALSLLYLGEGAKKKNGAILGNSNPLILRFFITSLQRLYKISANDVRCELHLRADQDAQKMIVYWSKILKIPRSNFTKPFFDKRTEGKASYPYYKGVCVVRCSRVAIQRRLVYIANTFCTSIVEQMRG
jgi:hypothetical protein